MMYEIRRVLVRNIHVEKLSIVEKNLNIIYYISYYFRGYPSALFCSVEDDSLTYLLTYLMNNNGVARTVQATLSLLNIPRYPVVFSLIDSCE